MKPCSGLSSIAHGDTLKQDSVDDLDSHNAGRSLLNLARRYHFQWLP